MKVRGRVAACGMALSLVGGAAVIGVAPNAGASTSAPGVTSKTVTVGSISDISLPIPGLFLGAKIGTEAYFAYINSQGGVNGRKLELNAQDSAFSSGTVANETKQIAQNDFAMVGGFSLLDAAEKPTIDATSLPMIAQVLSPQLQGDKNLWSAVPVISGGEISGPTKWLAKKYPNAVKNTGVIGSSAAATAVSAEHVFRNMTTSEGWKWTYSRDAGYAETTFLPDIVKMKSLGVKNLFEPTQQAPYIATMAQEMKQQGLDAMLTGGANLYAKNFDPGSAGNGAIFTGVTALYMGEDAKVVPAVATFDKWVKKTDPSTNLDLYTLYGWINAQLFAQALKNAGQNPTRASLVAALNKITSFNASGLLSPQNPAKAIPGQCWLAAQYENGAWHRISPDPKSGFVCSPGGLYPSSYKGISR